MKACIILHNMIIEDERGLDLPCENGYYEGSDARSEPVSRDMNNAEYEEFLVRNVLVRDGETHEKLRNDLIEHLWRRKGRSERNI